MKRFMAVLFLLACAAVSFCDSVPDYRKSAGAVPDSRDQTSLSKLRWGLQIAGKNLVMDCHGRMRSGGTDLVFAPLDPENDLVSGVEYLALGGSVILSVGFDNADSSYGGYYRLDPGSGRQPELLTWSSGMGASQFLSDGKTVFEATQFCFRLFDLRTKKDVWLNQESVGTDYHYKNIVTYLGGNTARIEFMHTVRGAQKFESVRIDLSDGKLVDGKPLGGK